MWEKIEKMLAERGLTRYRLSLMAGLNHNSLTDLKLGRKKSLRFEDVVKITDALGVGLDYFR